MFSFISLNGNPTERNTDGDRDKEKEKEKRDGRKRMYGGGRKKE